MKLLEFPASQKLQSPASKRTHSQIELIVNRSVQLEYCSDLNPISFPLLPFSLPLEYMRTDFQEPSKKFNKRKRECSDLEDCSYSSGEQISDYCECLELQINILVSCVRGMQLCIQWICITLLGIISYMFLCLAGSLW